MGDGEVLVEREVGGVAVLADLLGPDLARDVDQHAAAVALAVDVAGAVEHLVEGVERQRDRRVRGLAVLADRGVERAGVLVLDRLRRDAGASSLCGAREARRLRVGNGCGRSRGWLYASCRRDGSGRWRGGASCGVLAVVHLSPRDHAFFERACVRGENGIVAERDRCDKWSAIAEAKAEFAERGRDSTW